MLYVRADGDFTAEATYAGLDGETLTRTISVARYPQLAPFSAFSARAGEHQYHITDVTKVGGEWLITFEGEDQSYCLDEGMNGKPSASVYWTYYGTTDLLDKAVAAGCSSKLGHPALCLGTPAGGQQQWQRLRLPGQRGRVCRTS